MVWVKLDDSTPSRPEILALSPTDRWFWLAGLCYVGKHLTDGVIPTAAIHTFGVPNPKTAAARLVAAKLWTAHANGFFVPDYLDYNLSREVVERKRAETRARVRKFRSNVGNGVTPTGGNEDRSASPVPSRPKDQRSAPLRDASDNVRVLKALAQAVVDEGKDWSYPGGYVDLTEEIKSRAAHAGIEYDSTAIGAAMRAAEAEWNRKREAA